ncbi:sugar nucleotide-binding protein [Pseudohalioglobus sediminis]|uniref:dTDP-4-dehydrorhamnose reductase n=1 Tax=Pseudohalioglobus sediminis TaxID=2606449 RepID=A0A5B0WQL4_9GAMM|nr:sugar nucleotide-binding protein [Pseudohalioglobus sediminis]KAA1188481.1 sugar nucleotide-binding protein [Pseudohalioglobus sediminis]
MRVLIIGSDSPLGRALTEHMEHLGRHELVCLTRAASRWKSERQAKKTVRRADADAVVDVRMEAAADSGREMNELDLKRCQWVAKAAQRGGACYLFVSSARVFSGELDRMYNEDDVPDNTSPSGMMLAASEAVVQQYCDRHLILRLGRVFASDGANLVTRMLGEMIRGERLVLDNNLRGGPVASVDGARVVAALLDQISAGAELWGIYHYCSSETATYYEFAEAILASASQFSEFSAAPMALQPLEPGAARLNRSLECSKIRNTFAIKQQPWRGAIADQVKQYFQQQD